MFPKSVTFSSLSLLQFIFKNSASILQKLYFNERKQLLLSARLSHRNSVHPSVTWVDQSKTVPGRL